MLGLASVQSDCSWLLPPFYLVTFSNHSYNSANFFLSRTPYAERSVCKLLSYCTISAWRNKGEFCLLWCSLVAQMVKNLPAVRRPGFDPWVGKIPWRRKWQPTPIFLPGKSHGQRSLAGYSPWGCRVGHDWLHFQFSLLPLLKNYCLDKLFCLILTSLCSEWTKLVPVSWHVMKVLVHWIQCTETFHLHKILIKWRIKY